MLRNKQIENTNGVGIRVTCAPRACNATMLIHARRELACACSLRILLQQCAQKGTKITPLDGVLQQKLRCKELGNTHRRVHTRVTWRNL